MPQHVVPPRPDRVRQGADEARPAGAAIVLVARGEDRQGAACADEGPPPFLMIERARAGSFGRGLAKHAILGGRQAPAPFGIAVARSRSGRARASPPPIAARPGTRPVPTPRFRSSRACSSACRASPHPLRFAGPRSGPLQHGPDQAAHRIADQEARGEIVGAEILLDRLALVDQLGAQYSGKQAARQRRSQQLAAMLDEQAGEAALGEKALRRR